METTTKPKDAPAFVNVKGELYDVRDELKSIGGFWDPVNKVWRVPAAQKAAAERIAVDATKARAAVNLARWREYIGVLVWARGTLAESCYKAGLRAAALGVDFGDAVREIFERRRRGGGNTPESQTEREVRRAYAYAAAQPVDAARVTEDTPRPKKAEYEPEKLAHFAGPLVKEMSSEWLWKRSPVDVRAPGMNAEKVLRCLYLPGERVVIFDVFESQGQWIGSPTEGIIPCEIDYRNWTRAAKPPVRRGRDFDGRGANGIWFLANPVDGFFRRQEGLDDKGRPKWSRRSEDSVKSWRYMVLESDEADKREWCAALARLPLPIAAIYESGGKSVHALVTVNAESKLQFDQFRETAKTLLVPLGADPAAMSAVRLSRLPCCWRGRREQRLLWLADFADVEATPLEKRAVMMTRRAE